MFLKSTSLSDDLGLFILLFIRKLVLKGLKVRANNWEKVIMFADDEII